MRNGCGSIVREARGASAVEFALVSTLLLSLVFGIVEFTLALFQWNSAETATQMGARLAVESDAVASELRTYSGVSDDGLEPGTLLTTATVPAFTIRCTNIACTCVSGACKGLESTYDAAAFNAIVSEVQIVFPTAQAANLRVEYSHIGLGFAGRPGADLVPSVTVELTGLTFNFLFLDVVLDVLTGGAGGVGGGIPMPPFTATLTAEDLNSAGA